MCKRLEFTITGDHYKFEKFNRFLKNAKIDYKYLVNGSAYIYKFKPESDFDYWRILLSCTGWDYGYLDCEQVNILKGGLQIERDSVKKRED